MVKHILVGVDGSQPSIDAAHYAMDLAQQTGAKLSVAFVIETPQVIPVGPLSGYLTTAAPRSQEDIQKAQALVEQLVKERPNLSAQTRVEMGQPAEVLCQLAQQLGVELLVVGARGHGAAHRFLMGSISDRVVHHAHCPVLVVRK